MKKVLLFAATAAAILSGCSKQFVDEPENLGASASNISFETYVSNPTKGVIKGGFVMGDRFKVIGGKTGPNVAFDIANPSFTGWVFDGANFADNGATVSNYGGTPIVWRYDNPVGWDSENVTFFGFSPVPQAGTGEQYGITYAAPANLNTIPSIKFEVKGGYDPAKPLTDPDVATSRPLTKQQVDLLWVSVPDQTKAHRTVNMLFRHALTRLTFAVRSKAPAGHSIRINSLVVKNVIVDGTLALAHDENAQTIGREDYLGGWTPGTTKKNFAVNLINSVASLIKDNEIHTLTDADEALMVIPQDLTGVELELRYASSVDGVEWENYETGVEIKVKLDDLTTHWNPNKQIRYVLNVTPGDVIGFSADVTSWGDEGDIEFLSFETGKDLQAITTMTLVVGDKIRTLTDGAWITYAEGTNAAANLSTTDVVAVAGDYTFAVKNNIATTAREDQIIIEHVGGKKTIIKVTQNPGTGVVKTTTAAGEVASFVLKTGDKISAPQTKADATWVLIDGNALTSEFTAAADGEVVISVEANKGVARKAEFTVTPAVGDAKTYTVEQSGIEIVKTTLAAAAAVAHTGAASEEIALVSGGGTWLTYTEENGTATELTATAVTTAKAYTLNVAANNTGATRKAVFTVMVAGQTKGYEVTQVSEKTETKAILATGGEVFAGVTLAEGDYIELVAGATAKFKINNGTTDIPLSGKISAAGTYTVTANENLKTEVEKTAKIKVKVGEAVTVYEVTVAKATATTTDVPIAAIGGEVLAATAYEVGDSFEITTLGTALFTINDGTTTSDFTTKVEAAAGTYTIAAKANSTNADQTATITVIKGGIKSIYNVTVAKAAAATETPVSVEAIGGEVLAETIYANGDYIELTTAGTAELMIAKNSDAATALAGKIEITGDDKYTITSKANTTLTAKTATVQVSIGGVVTNYNVTVKAATETPKTINAAGGEVFADIVIADGEYIEVIGGGTATFVDGSDAAFTGKVATAGTYTVKAVMNATTTAKTASIVVKTAASVTVYTVSVNAATAAAIEFAEAGEAKEITLATGDVIKAIGGAAHSWLSAADPTAAETVDFSADHTVVLPGQWNVTATDNTGASLRTENFTVIKADGSVVIYTANQAGA